MHKERELTCPKCGKIFTTNGPWNVKYCPTCRKDYTTYMDTTKRHYAEMKTFACRKCGNTFESKFYNAVYCPDCIKTYGRNVLWRESNAIYKREKRAAQRSIKRKKICKYCGKEFVPEGQGNTKYCPECIKTFGKNIYVLSKIKGTYHEKVLREKIINNASICEYCGESFTIDPKSPHKKYCDACMDKFGKHVYDKVTARRMREEKQKEFEEQKKAMRPRSKPKVSIKDIVVKATAVGLSYGEYVSRYHI